MSTTIERGFDFIPSIFPQMVHFSPQRAKKGRGIHIIHIPNHLEIPRYRIVPESNGVRVGMNTIVKEIEEVLCIDGKSGGVECTDISSEGITEEISCGKKEMKYF